MSSSFTEDFLSYLFNTCVEDWDFSRAGRAVEVILFPASHKQWHFSYTCSLCNKECVSPCKSLAKQCITKGLRCCLKNKITITCIFSLILVHAHKFILSNQLLLKWRVWHHGSFNEFINAKCIFMLTFIFLIELQLTLINITIVVRCKSEFVF